MKAHVAYMETSVPASLVSLTLNSTMIYPMPPVPAEPTQLDRIEQELSEIRTILSHLIQALAQDDDEPNDGTRDQTQPL